MNCGYCRISLDPPPRDLYVLAATNSARIPICSKKCARALRRLDPVDLAADTLPKRVRIVRK